MRRFLSRHAAELQMCALLLVIEGFILGILLHDMAAGRVVHWAWYTWCTWIFLLALPAGGIGYIWNVTWRWHHA